MMTIKIRLVTILLALMLILSVAAADKGQTLSFKAVAPDGRQVSSSDLFSQSRFNWVTILSPEDALSNLPYLYGIVVNCQDWGYRYTLLVRPATEEQRSSILDDYNDLVAQDEILKDCLFFFPEGTKLATDQPVTCFLNDKGVLLTDEVMGDPMSSDLVDIATSLADGQAAGQGEPAEAPEPGTDAGADTGASPDTAPAPSTDQPAQQSVPQPASGGSLSFSTVTSKGTPISSQEILSRGWGTALYVVNSDDFGLMEQIIPEVTPVISHVILVADADRESLKSFDSYVPDGNPTLIIAPFDGSDALFPAPEPDNCTIYYLYPDGTQAANPESLFDASFSPAQAFTEYRKSHCAGVHLAFSTTDFENAPVSSQELFSNNRVTLIMFWGSWCDFCAAEMPTIQQIANSYASDGLGVIGLMTDNSSIEFDIKNGLSENDIETEKQDAIRNGQAKLDNAGVSFQNYWCCADVDSTVPTLAVPGYLLVDSNGIILDSMIVGSGQTSQLEQMVDKHLR